MSKNAIQARWRRKLRLGRCRSCGKPTGGSEYRQCPRCFALKRKSQMPGTSIDVDALAEFVRRAREPSSTCAVSGLCGRVLRALGDRLSVDRVVPSLGYVPGNMRLLSLRLNTAKGQRRAVPVRTLARLLDRAQRVS